MHRWRLLVLVFLAGLLLAAVLVQAWQEPHGFSNAPDDQLDPRPMSGQATNFQLIDHRGKRVALRDFQGRTVLLNFWATWCEPCKDELPHLARLAQRLRSVPIQIVLVSVDDSFEAIRELASQLGQAKANQHAWQQSAQMLLGKFRNVSILLDPNSQTAATYGTQKFPETYLIDKEQRLRTKFIGPKPWGMQAAEMYLRKQMN